MLVAKQDQFTDRLQAKVQACELEIEALRKVESQFGQTRFKQAEQQINAANE